MTLAHLLMIPNSQACMIMVLKALPAVLMTHVCTQTVVGIMAGPLKVDFGCQTPTHFVEGGLASCDWRGQQGTVIQT